MMLCCQCIGEITHHDVVLSVHGGNARVKKTGLVHFVMHCDVTRHQYLVLCLYGAFYFFHQHDNICQFFFFILEALSISI